ncbi:MAG: PEP-CTERM sorting domain-containing protein [Verrucomicrobiota bacterium]
MFVNYSFGQTLTATVSGLNSGQSYNLNFLFSLVGVTSGYTEDLSINGGPSQLITLDAANEYYGIYDTSLSANAVDGEIQATFSNANSISGASGPGFSALIVTQTDAVPEPATWTLMIGGLCLMVVIGNFRRKGGSNH